jgi:hypothetical protein
MGAGIFIVAMILRSLGCDCASALRRSIMAARRALPFDDPQDCLPVVITLPPSRAFPGASRRVWPAASFICHICLAESIGGRQ